MGEEDKHAERRAQIFAQSLETSHEPRFGYFGFTGPLAIGDNSLAPQAKRKKVSEDDSGEPIRNMVCNPPKKGAGPDAYFSFEPPLAIGDLYIDPLLRTKKPKCRPIDPEQMFKAGGRVKNHKHKALYEYLPQCTSFRDPLAMYAKYKDQSGPRNFYTRPSKKGGGGIYTPGVLFGDIIEEHEGFFWHHVPDDYDYWRKLKAKEREEHLSKLQEQNFNSGSYGNKCFFSDRETFFTDLPRGVPREQPGKKPFPHEAPFFPARPPRKGFNACMAPFPEHMPDPIPEAKFRKAASEEGPPPWNPATKKVVGKT